VKDRPQSNSTHLAGEYFVAAELYKRGYSVAMTLGNAKAIDLFAEMGTRTVNVQVKALRFRKYTGWPITKSKVLRNIIYVFVCLNDEDVPPSYFICTSAEARSRVKQYATRGIINYGALNTPEFRDRWDKLKKALRKVGEPVA
jgi:hypothetical protein